MRVAGQDNREEDVELQNGDTEVNVRDDNEGILEDHIEIRASDEVFIVSVSNDEALPKNSLKIQLDGGKPFACSICQELFAQKSDLKEHVRGHNCLKQFACSLCFKMFSHQNDLDIHLKIHAGEKPFVCPMCNKMFLKNCFLNRHMKTRANDELLAIASFNQEFNLENNLDENICENPSCYIHPTKFFQMEIILKNSTTLRQHVPRKKTTFLLRTLTHCLKKVHKCTT